MYWCMTHGLNSACSLMRCPSTIGATYVSIFHRAYTCGIVVISVCMALNIDCLYNLGTLFSVKHLLSIYIAAAFLFLGAAIPLLYYSSKKVYTSVTSSAASVCSTECLVLLDMVP